MGEDRRRQARDPAALSWMLARGWLRQNQHDALRGLARFGAHPLHLSIERRGREPSKVCDEVALHAADLLELHMHTAIDCEIRDGVRPGDLAAIRREVRASFPHAPPAIGLWAPTPRQLDVVEGSHLEPGTADPAAGVEYGFGDRTLLFLDLDALIGVRGGERDGALAAFVPCRPEEGR